MRLNLPKIGIPLLFALLLAVSACGGSSEELDLDGAGTAEDPYRLSFGGVTPGGSAYQVTTAYGEILNSQLDHVQVDVEVTGGGADNVALIRDGEIQAGSGNSGVGYAAYHGVNDYEGDPHEEVIGWLPFYEYPFQIVVPENSDIEGVEDLVDRDVGVNVRGSGGEVTAREVFGALGINPEEDFSPHYLDYAEAANALRTGQLDATIFSTGAPTPQLVEMQATQDVRIVTFTDEEMALVDDAYPWLTAGAIPAGTYDGMDEDIPTVHAATMMYINEAMPDDLVYELTETIWESQDRLANNHPTQEFLDEGLVERVSLPIMPLHPGAESYFADNGLIDQETIDELTATRD